MRSFSERNGFSGESSYLFELYVASVYLQRYLGGDVKLLDDVVIGGGDDEGVDVAAIVINGEIILDPGDVTGALEDRDDNDVRAIFIQAKTSEKFDTKLIAKFLHGVELCTNAAAKRSRIPLDSGLSQTVAILEAVIENIDRFRTTRIPAEMYFVTTAKQPSEEAASETQVVCAINRLRDLDVYSDDLILKLHGRNEISAKEKERKGPQNIEFRFPRKQSIPEVDGINQAYTGVLQASELIKILWDGEGMRSGIFDDNVRLNQGNENRVNQRIYSTLTSENRNMFPFLNNGVTIVARSLTNVADRFSMSGYQIVNGGQTSHQLVRWFQSLDADQKSGEDSLLTSVWIPVKLIETSDSDIVSEVTIATNLQTSIAQADIQGSTQDAKNVEQYFEQSGQDGLRYARQSGVTEDPVGFTRLRVVTTTDLNRSVASCIFGESWRAIGSPNELTAQDSYVWGGYPVPLYYLSAWIVYRIESYFRRYRDNFELQALKAAKYHIAMLVAAKCFPEVEKIHANYRDQKAMNAVAQKGSTGNWKEKIEESIESCVSIVGKYFADVTAQGRSLRKDDVRARKVQQDLLVALHDGPGPAR
ncbi:AIPR family protein [Mycolicibacterium litorale]|nr:AIPR family protein [Mycolicibacterium litorale]MCV7415939.1 AIPR family protein [Mycolicibacterium litorale]